MKKNQVYKPIYIGCMLLATAMAVSLTYMLCEMYVEEFSIMTFVTTIGAISYYVIAYLFASALNGLKSTTDIPKCKVYMDLDRVFQGAHGFSLTRNYFETLGDPMAAILFSDERMALLTKAIERELLEEDGVTEEELKRYIELCDKMDFSEDEEDEFYGLQEVFLNVIETTAMAYGMKYYEDFDEVENMAIRAAKLNPLNTMLHNL